MLHDVSAQNVFSELIFVLIFLVHFEALPVT